MANRTSGPLRLFPQLPTQTVHLPLLEQREYNSVSSQPDLRRDNQTPQVGEKGTATLTLRSVLFGSLIASRSLKSCLT